MQNKDRVFLDACCLINLLSTGRAEEILQELPYDFAVASVVKDHEILRLRLGGDESEEIDLGLYIQAGLLTVVDIRSPEELFELAGFASRLDDGEAWTCALAACHGSTVATDDRKAIRVLSERAPSIPVRQTPELLYEWCDQRELTDFELRKILGDVRKRARFVPRKNAHRADWWRRYLQPMP